MTMVTFHSVCDRQRTHESSREDRSEAQLGN